jgi:hypothetical protein
MPTPLLDNNMEITREEFIKNLEQLPEEAQEPIFEILEEYPSDVLKNLFSTVGVQFPTSIDEPMRREDSIDYMPPGVEVDQPMENKRWDPDTGEEMTTPNNSPEDGRDTLLQEAQREGMALGDQPTEPVQNKTAGMLNVEGKSDSGVADDIPLEAKNNSFIVNAAAIKRQGYRDFIERILKPNIESLEERTGIKIELASITNPQKQVNGEARIAVSNGEMYIPPELAEEIGYDLLEKINNRGKPETEKKLEEQKEQQPQDPQAEMQAALGKRIGMSNGGPINTNKILDSIKKVETGPNTPEDKRYIHSRSAKSGAFGPHQITGGLVDDVVRRYSKEFSPEFKKYVDDFKQQTDDNINMQRYSKIYRDGKHDPKLTKELGPLVKGGGPGYIPLETHKKFYPLLLDYSLSISTDKGKITDPATIFKNWHRSPVDKENVIYVKKTMKEFNKPSPSIEIPLDSNEEDIRSAIESIPFPYSGKATGASTFEDPNRPN